MAADEAQLRRRLGDQFDMAVETAIDSMMEQEKQQLTTKKQPAVEKATEQVEGSDSSSVYQQIDTAMIEE